MPEDSVKAPVRLEERWRDFVREEAVPVIRSHLPEIQEALQAVLRDLASDEDVRTELRSIALHVGRDPELRTLVADVLRSVLVDNPRLEAFLEERWADPRVRARLETANDQLQTFFDRVGNLLFFDVDGTGINPDLARVLRILLLRRDRSYLFLEPDSGPALETGETLRGTRDV